MISYAATVDGILSGSNLAPVRKLREAMPYTFSSDEIYEIEKLVVAGTPRGKTLGKFLQIVYGKIAALDPAADATLRTKATYHYPKYKNILDADFPAAEALLAKADRWLNLPPCKPESELRGMAGFLVARLIVAAVIEMQILSVKPIKGLLESVRDKRVMKFDHGLLSIPFQVAMRQGWHPQEGCVNLKGCGCAILTETERLRRSSSWNAEFERLCALDPDQLLSEIDFTIAASCDARGAFLIGALCDAACVMAIERMPTSVRAVRRGVAISYAPELAAVRRLTGKLPPWYPAAEKRHKSSDAGEDSEEDDRDPNDEKEPAWKTILRATVKKSGVDTDKLAELQECEEQEGKTMAQYVTYMDGKPKIEASTIYRFTWPIANKLMPCLGDHDPSKLTLDEWEDLAESLLDEEAYFHDTVYSGSNDRDAAGYARPLIKALRSFVECFWRGKDELKEFNDLLPKTGYIRVLADFVTVDEYRRALERLHSWRVGPRKKHLIRAARVALILGFRLGLRIAELAFLRVSDFDKPGKDEDLVLANLHLRVRPWLLRKLKTANADRDLPLSVLIPRDELKEVIDFVFVSPDLGDKKNAPLFGQERNPSQVMTFPRVIEILKKVFDGKGRDCIHRNFHFHLLRHSAANLWLLKLTPGLHEVAKQVLANHPETLEEISDTEKFRLDLMETTEIRGEDLQAVALLLGHGAAAVSMHHYLHVLWWWTAVERKILRPDRAKFTGLKGLGPPTLSKDRGPLRNY